jgi:hypothetical protein
VGAGSNTSTVALRIIGVAKGNPAPGGITGPTCSNEMSIRGPGPPGGGTVETERVTVSMISAELGPQKDCAGEGQQQLQMTYASYRERRCYIRTMKEHAARESQGAWRQDELVGLNRHS